MSQFGYFKRLMEMTTRDSKQWSSTFDKKGRDELNKNTDGLTISTQPHEIDFQSETFTYSSISDNNLERRGSQSKKSSEHGSIYTEHDSEATPIMEKKPQPLSSSHTIEHQTRNNENNTKKKNDERSNLVNSAPATSLDVTAANSPESNLQEDNSQIKSQFSSSPLTINKEGFDGKADLPSKNNLERLLNNSPFTNAISASVNRIINSKNYQDILAHKPMTFEYNSKSDRSVKNDHVSVSIDRIVVNVRSDDRRSVPEQNRNNSEKNEAQGTDGLRRHYLRLS